MTSPVIALVFGGTTGTAFNDYQGASSGVPCSGIDWLQIYWDSNTLRGATVSYQRGGVVSHGSTSISGLETDTISLADNEEITSVVLYASDFLSGRVGGMMINTSLGQSVPFGNTTNGLQTALTIPTGATVQALCGQSGADLDALGFVVTQST